MKIIRELHDENAALRARVVALEAEVAQFRAASPTPPLQHSTVALSRASELLEVLLCPGSTLKRGVGA
jgi:cell division septum initiation protein DivIVA